MLLRLFTPCNGLYIRHFRNRRKLEPKCVPRVFPGSLQGTRQAPTQTFLRVRHAFLPHFTCDEPLRTSAWEVRNSPVRFGQLLASFFMSPGTAPEVFEKVNLVSFLQVSKVRKDFFTHFLKPYLLIGYFLLQLVYLLLTDKSDQFVLDLMHKTQKLWRQGK